MVHFITNIHICLLFYTSLGDQHKPGTCFVTANAQSGRSDVFHRLRVTIQLAWASLLCCMWLPVQLHVCSMWRTFLLCSVFGYTPRYQMSQMDSLKTRRQWCYTIPDRLYCLRKDWTRWLQRSTMEPVNWCVHSGSQQKPCPSWIL